mmetsp:Transcript_9998/g.19198  ORF Transcript_9998/g.19198 Transcript_9998/m.19198 type:complete len:236 (-) Transcript_9998:119-826(-)
MKAKDKRIKTKKSKKKKEKREKKRKHKKNKNRHTKRKRAHVDEEGAESSSSSSSVCDHHDGHEPARKTRKRRREMKDDVNGAHDERKAEGEKERVGESLGNKRKRRHNMKMKEESRSSSANRERRTRSKEKCGMSQQAKTRIFNDHGFGRRQNEQSSVGRATSSFKKSKSLGVFIDFHEDPAINIESKKGGVSNVWNSRDGAAASSAGLAPHLVRLRKVGRGSSSIDPRLKKWAI